MISNALVGNRLSGFEVGSGDCGMLCCQEGKLPMTCLGMPLGFGFKAITVWNKVLERMEKRLAGWKKIISLKGGRITLINSTLSNLTTL